MPRRLMPIGLLVIAEAATGILIWELFFQQTVHGVLSLTTFTIGMTVYFGFMMVMSRESTSSLNKTVMRTAISGAIIVTYLFVLSFYFYVGWTGELPEIIKILMNSFTAVVSITIVFYFGSEAVIQAFASTKDESNSQNNSDSDS